MYISNASLMSAVAAETCAPVPVLEHPAAAPAMERAKQAATLKVMLQQHAAGRGGAGGKRGRGLTVSREGTCSW